MSGLAPVALPVDDPPPSSLNIQDAPPLLGLQES
jgi:hypothetical protein